MNDYIYTKMEKVSGLPRAKSRRARDFRLKVWWMTQTYGSGRIVKMTGTFISNTLAELWKEMMDLCPEQMRLRGWHIFDAWAAVCGNIKTGAAIKNTGTIERESRFSEFVNLPEQLQLLHSVADIQTADSVGVDLHEPIPKYVNVVAPMSDFQREYMDELVDRSNAVKARRPMTFLKVDKFGNPVLEDDGTKKYVLDNNLFITTDGRKAVLDYRLIDPEAKDFYKSKINMCVRRAARLWRRTQASRSTQIIFCDMGVPNRNNNFCIYYHIRDRLIAMGVDPEEIAIAQEWKSDEKRLTLHQMIREGEIRIVIASTEMLGVGANVHAKLLAIHHCDVRWRPRDMQQRVGRIIRPGNTHSRVLVYRYITQGRDGNVGFDSFMYDKLKYKIRFIQQLMTREFNLRRIEEDASEDPTFSAAEIVALATGDMRIMAYVELEAELQLSRTLLSGYQKEIDQIKHYRYASSKTTCIPFLEREIQSELDRLKSIQPDVDLAALHVENCTGENFKITIRGEEYTDRVQAAKRLQAIAERLELSRQQYKTEQTDRVGTYGGFNLWVQANEKADYLLLSRADTHLRWGYRQYSCRLLRDVYQACHRLEEYYLEIASQSAQTQKYIATCRKDLQAAKDALQQLEGKAENLRLQISKQEADKLTLEQELGLDKTEDELAVVEFDEEGEE